MKLEFGICKICNLDKLIVNRKYYCCETCNRVRLDLNSVNSTNISKRKESLLEVKKTTKKKNIRAVSKKESKNQDRLKKVYKEIDSEREIICEGCGQHSMLSHSHLISQKNKKFQCDKGNIIFHCMQREVPDRFGNKGCHERWESGQLDQILTLRSGKSHLDYIETRDPQKYKKITQIKYG